MPPPSRIKQHSLLPDLEWLITDDGSRTLWDSMRNETYHSGCGAVAESLVVYLRNSGVLQRLRDRRATKVFELGFGTGTAFLLTAAIAEKLSISLDYWAIDIRPLPAQFVTQLDLQPHLARVIADNFVTNSGEKVGELECSDMMKTGDFDLLPVLVAQLSQELERAYPSSAELSTTSISLGNFCSLHLINGDMTKVEIDRDYPELISQFNAVYFDAFSPESCPELWTMEVITQMWKLLGKDGTLTSYCVKSAIRKILEAAGFSVKRLPGPVGGKREVLKAERS